MDKLPIKQTIENDQLAHREKGEVTRPGPRVVIYGQLPYRMNQETGEKSGGHFSGSIEIMQAVTDWMAQNNVPDDMLVQSRDMNNLKNAFFKGHRADRQWPETIPESIPDLVFILPEMRAYDGSGGRYVDTPTELIEAMCEEYGVPRVRITEEITPDELGTLLGQVGGSRPPELTPSGK